MRLQKQWLQPGLHRLLFFDGQNTYTRDDYERNRSKQVGISEILKSSRTAVKDTAEGDVLQGCDPEGCQRPTEGEQQTPQDSVHTVYIDGSCIRNGTASAQAGIGLFWGDGHPMNSSITLTADHTHTNNTAELTSAITAIQQASENNMKELLIKSDSKYVVNGVTEWVQKWMGNGWKTASGEPVENKEEWTKLTNIIKSSNISIKWEHVAAHSGISGNEEADRLALRAAKMENSESQHPETTTAASSVKSTDTNEHEKVPSANHPHIIMISSKKNERGDSPKKLTVINVPTTPNRTTTRDKSETPVPGLVNGSFVANREKVKVKVLKQKNEQQSSSIESMDSTQAVKIMKNIENVLQNVMLEVHQLKQQQINFGVEVKDQLHNLHSRQLNMQNSISGVSNDFTSAINRCYNKIETLTETKKTENNLDKTNDVMHDIASLHKKVDTSNDTEKNSIQTVESSISTLKYGVEKISKECQVEFKELETKNTQLQETVTEVRRDMKTSKEVISEIEKSLTVLTRGYQKVRALMP